MKEQVHAHEADPEDELFIREAQADLVKEQVHAHEADPEDELFFREAQADLPGLEKAVAGRR